MAEKVKAWAFKTPGYPECLSQTFIPSPSAQSLSSSQIIVRVHAAALNPVDIQLMNLPLFNIPIPPLNREKPIGCDFSGTVIAAGAYSGFQKNDEIFGVSIWMGWNGTLSEVACIDVNKATICKKPASWSWEQAAAISLVWLTARACIQGADKFVNRAHEKKMAILGGSSACGMYVTHIARQRGYNIMATCSERNAAFVRDMGANHIIDYTKDNVRESIRAFEPDAIIDCVGGTECIDIANRYITIVGDKTDRSAMGGAMTYLWSPQMWFRWFKGRFGLSAVAYDCINIEMNKNWLEEAFEVPKEKIIIDSVYEFDQAKEALARLNTGRARGKVIVKVAS